MTSYPPPPLFCTWACVWLGPALHCSPLAPSGDPVAVSDPAESPRQCPRVSAGVGIQLFCLWCGSQRRVSPLSASAALAFARLFVVKPVFWPPCRVARGTTAYACPFPSREGLGAVGRETPMPKAASACEAVCCLGMVGLHTTPWRSMPCLVGFWVLSLWVLL